MSEPKRNNNIVRIEERITELVNTDIMNEEIYVLLKKLAYIYINQNKFTYGYNGIEDVCHDVAADVWMTVINGRVIKSWMYYIGKMIKMSYVIQQRKIEHEVIDTENDPNYRYNVKLMCASSSISCMEEFDNMERNLVLDNIGGMILGTMSKTKFKIGSREYLDLYTNVCINLLRELDNEEYIYFRLDPKLQPYVQIIIEQFKKDFRNSGFTDSISDNVDDDLEMMITSDESIMKSLKRG